MGKYHELKMKAIDDAPMDGIFYAFSDKQFAEGLAKCGYTQADVDNGNIVTDGFGGYGTTKAFDKRSEFYAQCNERIKIECTPDEVFRYEYLNYECAFSGDMEDALKITRSYFPDYKPSVKLIAELDDQALGNVRKEMN